MTNPFNAVPSGVGGGLPDAIAGAIVPGREIDVRAMARSLGLKYALDGVTDDYPVNQAVWDAAPTGSMLVYPAGVVMFCSQSTRLKALKELWLDMPFSFRWHIEGPRATRTTSSKAAFPMPATPLAEGLS